jgi:hypothetical protein
MEESLGAAQRVRGLGTVRQALAEHRHAAIRQPDPAVDDAERLRLALGVERPYLGEGGVVLLEVLLVLPEPVPDGHRHVLAEVASRQLEKASGTPDLKRGLVGPHDAALVDVEDPNRGGEPIDIGGLVADGG